MRGWLLALWLAAFPAWPQQAPIVVGAAVSETGLLADLSREMRQALAALETETPIGRYRVGKGGVQLEAKPAVVQILRGCAEIVWPRARATAQLRLPYPRWDERPVHAAQ